MTKMSWDRDRRKPAEALKILLSLTSDCHDLVGWITLPAGHPRDYGSRSGRELLRDAR